MGVRVLLLPWLAHGHITPYLQLGKLLLRRNFDVYLCSTCACLTSIEKQLEQSDDAGLIQVVELHLPSLEELPPHLHTTNGLPLHLIPTLMEAFDAAGPAFHHILAAHRPDLVIYDFFQSWAPAAAASAGIPAVQFITGSAAACSFAIHRMTTPRGEAKYPFPEIYLRPEEEEILYEKPENRKKFENQFLESIRNSCDFVLLKTFREIEGKYIDYLSRLIGKKVVLTGPVIDDSFEIDVGTEGAEFTRWLAKKGECSTVFVSFGSENFFGKEDMEEMAYGLELSGVNFVWVLRSAIGEERVKLPEGFAERAGERGMVVEWAPQRMILAHPSIGGMMSHCGWGSVLQTMQSGVPIIAMPIRNDQPWNARLVVELGMGVEIVGDCGRRLQREAIARVVRDVIHGESGTELRRRAREVRDVLIHTGEAYAEEAALQLVKLCGRAS